MTHLPVNVLLGSPLSCRTLTGAHWTRRCFNLQDELQNKDRTFLWRFLPVFFIPIRWRSACRAASSPAWSWRWPIRAAPTRTGWPPSSPHVASCCCCASAATAKTARPTSGVTSWRPSCTRWAGAPRTTRPWCPPKVRRNTPGRTFSPKLSFYTRVCYSSIFFYHFVGW